MEENKTVFASELKADLPLFREFLDLSIDVYRRNAVVLLFMIVMLLHCIANMSNSFYVVIFAFLGISFSLTYWLKRRKLKDGGVAYKQLLYQHEGQTPHQIIRFEEEQLIHQNLITGTERKTPYSQYVQLWESKNLLVLILDVNMYQLIDKRSITGGTSDELIAFLQKKCPNLKKRVQTGRFCRFIRRLLWAVMVAGMVITLLTLFHIPEKLSGQITNDMSCEEIAVALAEVGIVIDPSTIDEMEAYGDGAWDLPGFHYEDHAKALYLLSWEGMGKYDYETWEWTPSTSGVYWFDMEVMDVSAIYTNFLRGLDAMDENLTFSNMFEDYSAADIENGTGIVTFSFDYQGEHYVLNAQYQYDWFDTNMLTQLGRILQQDSDAKSLWYTFDGQGVLLYYGTAAEALALEQKTGIPFLDPVNQYLYG